MSQWQLCPSCQMHIPIDGSGQAAVAYCPECGLALPAPTVTLPPVRWFCIQDKRKVGPLSFEELRQLAAAGRLQTTDMVLQEGTARWQEAAAVPGLFDEAANDLPDNPFQSVRVSALVSQDPVISTAPAAVPADAELRSPSMQPDVSATHASVVPPAPLDPEATRQSGMVVIPVPPPAASGAQKPGFSKKPGFSGTPAAGVPQQIGRFQVRSRLGAGAFGTVYRAFDPQLEREVALKVPQAGTLDSAKHVERFLREAKSAAQLRHPHIVPIYDAGQDGDIYYIASAFIDGKTLAHFIDESGGGDAEPAFRIRESDGPAPTRPPVDYRQVAQIVRELAEALSYAHSLGIVHRDVKPANVMLSQPPASGVASAPRENAASGVASGPRVPHLMDFGLAHKHDAVEKLTQEGAVMGTPAYMAPEQGLGQSGNPLPASDQYSLGVVLYEMLTGRLPFSGPPEIVIYNHIHIEPPPPRKDQPQIPRDLETICLKALAKRPEDRYAGCQALADDLRRFLDGEPITARRLSLGERLVKLARRRPALVAAYGLTVLVVVLLGLGTGAAWLWQRAEKERGIAVQERRFAEQEREKAELARGQAYESEKKAQEAEREAEAARRDVARLNYYRHVELAYRELQEGQYGHVRELLDSCDASLRHWEWGYVSRLCRLQKELKGHTNGVESVAFSPDGQRIVSGSGDQTVKVWDAKTGMETLTLKGHTAFVRSVVFSPDGKRIVSASSDQTIKVWDANTGQATFALNGHTNRVMSVACSGDGKRIVSGSWDQTLKVWDANTGMETLTLKGHTDGVTSVAFSSDCRQIVSGSDDKTVKVWDASTGQNTLTLKGHINRVTSVAFSPDCQLIVSGSDDKTAKVWDAKMGKETLALKGHTNRVTTVTFSPDGQRIVSGSWDQTLKVWDAKTGQGTLDLKGNTASVRSVAFSPDGQRIVNGSGDNTLKVWDANTNQETLALKGDTSIVLSMAFSPDGQRIVSGNRDHTLKVWDAKTGMETLTLKGHWGPVLSVVFNRDGQRIVSGSQDHRLKVWDAKTGQEILTLIGHTDYVRAVAFSPDGQRIVSGSDDKTVKVWDAKTGMETLTLKGHWGPVLSVVFNRDGQRIVSGSQDHTLKVWDAKTGMEILTLKGHTNWVTSVAFSLNGQRIVSGSQDHTLKVWDAKTGMETLTLKGRTTVTSVLFIPDGKRIVSGGYDHTLKVWDANTSQNTLTLKGHTGPVYSVAFSADGNRIVSGSADGTVRVWDAGR